MSIPLQRDYDPGCMKTPRTWFFRLCNRTTDALLGPKSYFSKQSWKIHEIGILKFGHELKKLVYNIYIYIYIPAPSTRCFLVTTGAQKPPVKVSKQPVGGSWYIFILISVKHHQQAEIVCLLLRETIHCLLNSSYSSMISLSLSLSIYITRSGAHVVQVAKHHLWEFLDLVREGLKEM